MKPFHRERSNNPAARLRQLEAVRRADKDERGLKIWQSPRYKTWITVKGDVLSFYRRCPCG